jgi:hypothetical protein
VDYDISLVSLTTGGSSAYDLNWTDLPATASLEFHALVLGGSDITRARVGAWVTAAANTVDDITVAVGAGKPDAVLTLANPWTGNGNGNNIVQQRDGTMMFGASNAAGTEARCSAWHANDATAASDDSGWLKASRIVLSTGSVATPTTENLEGALASVANWPTNGFRISYTDSPDFNFEFGYLALYGAGIKIGSTTSPTGVAPQTQTLSGTGGTNARGALFFSNHVPSAAGAVDSSSVQLGGFMFGGSDGTNHGVASAGRDDGTTNPQAWRDHNTAKSMRLVLPGAAAAMKAQCTATLVGPDVSLNWDTTDTGVAREFAYIIFNEAAAPPNRLRRWQY